MFSNLDIEGEGVESHGADESDARGEGVHQVVIIVNPEALQLAQDCVRLEALEVPDLHVRHPEVLEDGQVECSQRLHLTTCNPGSREVSSPWTENSPKY